MCMLLVSVSLSSVIIFRNRLTCGFPEVLQALNQEVEKISLVLREELHLAEIMTETHNARHEAILKAVYNEGQRRSLYTGIFALVVAVVLLWVFYLVSKRNMNSGRR
ncbi:hypothetical protein DL93DRAFT_784845 [Clavulina sp. PMI_390]|nr:hypothetical protein DL93DRAFT_784845 [Clavulina sp. PMI_390]